MDRTSPHRTFGRRHSRRWSQEREQHLFNHPLVLELPEAESFGLETFFEVQPQKLWLEIGFGYGEHLLAVTQTHPEVGIVGAEVYLSGVSATLEGLEAFGCTQARLFPGDGRLLLERLSDQTVEGVVLLFPDPWPKARHEKRQMFSPHFMKHLQRILKPGALFRFASDAPAYVEKVRETLAEHASFTCTASWQTPDRPPFEDWPPTRYERKALKAGRVCQYFHYHYVKAEA